MPPPHHHDPKPTPTNQNPTPTPPDPITNHRERPQMTIRYPSTSTALPTSLAMVFTASKLSLEAAGKPASIMLTPSLVSCKAMSSFSLEVGEVPVDCSPSRRVVSNMRT
nr:hypothetical protein CFP56_40488 [Quercus suber]